MSADARTLKRNLLQDLMQRARASTHSGSGVKFLSPGSLNSSLRGSRSSLKSPKTKSPRHKRQINLPSVFKHSKDTLSPGDSQKGKSTKESTKRESRSKRAKSPVADKPPKSPPQTTPLTKQQEAELEEKRNRALHQKVLQLIREKRPTPSKSKSEHRETESKQRHHVLYTTFEDNSLKQALTTEPISVVPWKTGKTIPTSPGRSITKVSYCASCGHVDDKVESVSARTTSPKKPTQVEPHKTTPAQPCKVTISKAPVAESNYCKTEQKYIEHAEDTKWETSPRPRCYSVPVRSPRRNDPETLILLQEVRPIKQATIKRSLSLQRRSHIVRRHTEPHFGPYEKERRDYIRGSVTHSTETRYLGGPRYSKTLEELKYFSSDAHYSAAYSFSRYSNAISGNGKQAMPKLKNGSAGDIYPLLKTKIPEECIQEDGSVTFRKAGQGGAQKHTDADRDSGVDIDNCGKTPSQANSNDSDFEYDHDSMMAPDSALEPSAESDMDFETLKRPKRKGAVTEEETDILTEESKTLTRHSTASEESSDDKWDMYALLKHFECVEWELKPADNLKRQTLDLDCCNLEAVPPAVTEIEYYAFRDVEAVSLNHNEKIENADVLGKLADLRIINMWGCSLRAIPQTWARLTKLQMLGLGNNKGLTDFGPLKHLTNIIWLDLGGCGLKKIPDEVTNMMKLKVLALGGNVGIEIGDEICSLWDLKKLGLNDCGLEEVPKSIFSLVKLTHLHLDNNYISHIDQEIVQLTDLVELTVTGNEDITFPKLLSQCDTIKCIVVDAAKDLTRVSGTLKSRMKAMPTAMSPSREPAPKNRHMAAFT